VADAATGRRVDADTIFRAGSVSKLATSLIALRLVERGVVALDTPVGALVPALGLPPPRPDTEPIRLAHLLEHTAGLAQGSHADFADHGDDAAPADYLARVGGLRPRWAPGLLFSYSNAGHTAAARVLEHAAGGPFDRLAERELFEPLGMRSASFRTHGADPARVSGSYARDGRELPVWRMDFRASGALSATPRDLAAMVVACLRRDEPAGVAPFLRRASLERMERGETSAAARAGVRAGSYGLGNFAFALGGRMFRGHWGKTEGFLTTVGYLPEAGRGFVLTLNTADGATMQSLREIAGAYLARDLPPPAPVRPAHAVDASDLAGHYAAHADDMPVRDLLFRLLSTRDIVREPDGALAVTARTGLAVHGERYRAAADGGYFAERLPIASAAAFEHAGRRYWTDGEAFVRVPAWRHHAERAGLAVAALGAIAAIVRGLGTFARRRSRGAGQRAARTVAALAGAGAVATLVLFVHFGLLGGDLRLLARPSGVSVAIAAASGLAVIAGLLAPMAWWATTPRPYRRGALAEGAIALTLAAIAGVWISAGWAPLVTWR
jgi:CubicO group peptidase (beta-lactamase class C family)